jgi:type VI secretion system secreted protein VgrG
MASDRVAYTQVGRMVAIDTPLGTDQLLLDAVDIHEGINGLFTIRADAKSQRDNLQAGDLIGSSVDFTLQLKDGATRAWNGFVTDLHEGSLTTRGTRNYALTVRPKLWLLSQKSDCRIFQDQATPQIIETLCAEHGITDFDLRITGSPPPQHYSVQWNETDLAYLLRRMEEDGLFYWFEHAVGKHTLVVTDHVSGYRPSTEPQPRYAQASADRDRITDWRRQFSFTPGRRAGRDWNFETMQSPSGTQSSFASVPGNATQELYEFPGRFLDNQAGEAMMKNRIQATETGFETVDGQSTLRTLAPGQTITPQDIAKPANVFEQQAVVAIRHAISNPSYESGSGQPAYDNSFSVIPAKTPVTPHRSQSPPKIIGSQIALIAGPSGEEIHTDQYGRVKLTFPWDRRAKGDGSDTCWVRVGQPWAGGTWGHQVIPRVGMEALVSYQDGDPDRPLVVALVPDPTNAVPYSLPDNKTRMVFRSNSYKATGFNEMTFEDKGGQENMFFHAQKDHTTKIENNQTLSVGASHSNVVGQNQALTVGQNQTQEIGGSANLTVGATGAGATALMAPFAGMAGQTAGMLGQALGAAGGGGMAALGSMVPQLASSVIGMLGASGQQAQQGVGNGPSPRPDAGTALASAGSTFGQAVQKLFSLPGMMNTIVGTMRTDHVGVAHAMQVGTSQVVNIGQTKFENIGKAHTHDVGEQMTINVGKQMQINVGEVFQIIVGKSTLTMDKDGNVIITGKTLTVEKSGQVTIHGNQVDINPAAIT